MSHQPNVAVVPTSNNTASAPPNAINTATIAKPNIQYRCNICEMGFPTAYRLMFHRSFHKNPRANNLTRLTVQNEFLKAVEEHRIPNPIGLQSLILAPKPINVALPLGIDMLATTISASSSINAPMISPPQATTKPKSSYNCNFCKRIFYNPYAFSAHFGSHKDLPASQWLEHGPRHSKIRRLIKKAVDEARRLNPLPPIDGRQASESGPTRDVPKPRGYPSDYPWWDLGPEDGSSTSGDVVPMSQGHEALGVENEGVSPAVHGKYLIPDLNEPYSPSMTH